MTGVSMIVQVDTSEVGQLLGRLRRVMGNTTPIMKAIGVGLTRNTRRRFDQAVDPEGDAWAPLNPVYAAGKSGPGILREAHMRGGLQGSITYLAGRDKVEVGTNKIYGAIHQFGGTITAKKADRLAFWMGGQLVRPVSVTIPARPFLGISDDDRETITDIVEGAIRRHLPH